MNWYMQSGKDSDVAISTRIRLARNISGFRFNLEKKEEIDKLKNKIKDNLFAIGYGLKFLELKDMDDITKMSLVEKKLISPKFVQEKNDTGAILINDEENICIMINEEEHISLQVFSSGLELENTLNLAIEIDEKLSNILGYATNKKYGYLTSRINNVGTALKASIEVFLPALSKTQNIRKILDVIGNFGMNITGMYGENSEIRGNTFQISNKQTLGITEKDIIENLKLIVDKIIKQEREARRIIAKDNLDIEDAVYRSYGLLTNCRKISLKETIDLLSYVKLGVDLGILKEITDLQVQKLYLYTKPANMQKRLQNEYEPLERDIKRAEIIKQIINEK